MKLELPVDKKLVHEMDLTMRWSDMDAMGHVNNAVYFRYMEVARIEWLRSLGCVPDASGFGPLVANVFCNFHRELVYPGELRLRSYTSNAGRSSFDAWVEITRADEPGTVNATGGATVVWVDYQARRSAPLPDWLRAAVG